MKTGRDLKPQKVGPDLQFNLNAPAAHPFDQHSVRRRIDRLRRRDPTGLAYVLQSGRRSSGGLGEGAAGATLIFDAIIDPLIGECSDRTRSRWGRRHPFMYASVPLAIAFYFLHSPPLGWS